MSLDTVDTRNKIRILFLQGHPSFFSRDWGRAMVARGHYVRRVNLCVGDWFFWHGPECTSYRGKLTDWPMWLEAILTRDRITHIVYFADRTPYHVLAQRVARRMGVVPVSYEFGYLRPDWIIVEEGGQSTFSHLTNRLDVIRDCAESLPMPDMTRRFTYPHSQEARHEVGYHLSNYFLAPLYPRYVADRTCNPVIEYLSYIPRNRRAKRNAAAAKNLIARLATQDIPYHVVAMQMEGDYQIRANSRYSTLTAFIKEVLSSFARCSPHEMRLVFKLHPMDNGRTDWCRIVGEMAIQFQVSDRVDFIDGGDLFALLKGAKGCVLVNSTVGLHALQQGCPVFCMGIATYDLAGLTHQGTLDQFWSSPEPPEAGGVEAIVKVLASTLHVRGDFFSASGRSAAVNGAVRLIEGDLAHPFATYAEIPPRLGKAVEQGLSIAPWDC